MSDPPETGIQIACKHWLSAATTLLACQWKLFNAQYRAGLKIMEAALGAGAGGGAGAGPATASDVEKLERLAAQRVSQGLPPPREIYQAHVRARIDWTRFPEWARPSDPELFDGCGHEG
jgi:hypothetical protein